MPRTPRRRIALLEEALRPVRREYVVIKDFDGSYNVEGQVLSEEEHRLFREREDVEVKALAVLHALGEEEVPGLLQGHREG